MELGVEAGVPAAAVGVEGVGADEVSADNGRVAVGCDVVMNRLENDVVVVVDVN